MLHLQTNVSGIFKNIKQYVTIYESHKVHKDHSHRELKGIRKLSDF